MKKKLSCNEARNASMFFKMLKNSLGVNKDMVEREFTVKSKNNCHNCTHRDLEYQSETCEFCTLINKKVGKLNICDFYAREIINK